MFARQQLEQYLRHIADGRHAYWQARARARRRGALITLTLAEWREVYASPTCHWCQMELHPSIRHIDHIVELSAGGEHSRSNLVAACANCNLRRAWERKTKYERSM